MSTVIITVIVAAVLVASFIGYYNSFVSKRNMAEQAFSTIDVMLKKRCDLVPNLVATVKQYMTHESTTLTRIAELRSRVGDSTADRNSRVEAGNEMNSLIGNILLQVERYPDLKANTSLMDLQTGLHNIEEQISAARRTFNAAITQFNNAVEMFPGNLFAGIFGFKRQKLLETPPEDRKNPDVSALFKR